MKYNLNDILGVDALKALKFYLSPTLKGTQNTRFGCDAFALCGKKDASLQEVLKAFHNLADFEFAFGACKNTWGDDFSGEYELVSGIAPYMNGMHNDFALKKANKNPLYLPVPLSVHPTSAEKGLKDIPLETSWEEIKHNFRNNLGIEIKEDVNLNVYAKKGKVMGPDNAKIKTANWPFPARLIKKVVAKITGNKDNLPPVKAQILLSKQFFEDEHADAEKFLTVIDVLTRDKARELINTKKIAPVLLQGYSDSDKRKLIYASQVMADLFVAYANNLGVENHRQIENALKHEIAGTLANLSIPEEQSHKAIISFAQMSQTLTDAMLKSLGLTRAQIIENRKAMGVAYVDNFVCNFAKTKTSASVTLRDFDAIKARNANAFDLNQIMFGRTLNKNFAIENNKIVYKGDVPLANEFEDVFEPVETQELKLTPTQTQEQVVESTQKTTESTQTNAPKTTEPKQEAQTTQPEEDVFEEIPNENAEENAKEDIWEEIEESSNQTAPTEKEEEIDAEAVEEQEKTSHRNIFVDEEELARREQQANKRNIFVDEEELARREEENNKRYMYVDDSELEEQPKSKRNIFVDEEELNKREEIKNFKQKDDGLEYWGYIIPKDAKVTDIICDGKTVLMMTKEGKQEFTPQYAPCAQIVFENGKKKILSIDYTHDYVKGFSDVSLELNQETEIYEAFGIKDGKKQIIGDFINYNSLYALKEYLDSAQNTITPNPAKKFVANYEDLSIAKALDNEMTRQTRIQKREESKFQLDNNLGLAKNLDNKMKSIERSGKTSEENLGTAVALDAEMKRIEREQRKEENKFQPDGNLGLAKSVDGAATRESRKNKEVLQPKYELEKTLNTTMTLFAQQEVLAKQVEQNLKNIATLNNTISRFAQDEKLSKQVDQNLKNIKLLTRKLVVLQQEEDMAKQFDKNAKNAKLLKHTESALLQQKNLAEQIEENLKQISTINATMARLAKDEELNKQVDQNLKNIKLLTRKLVALQQEKDLAEQFGTNAKNVKLLKHTESELFQEQKLAEQLEKNLGVLGGLPKEMPKRTAAVGKTYKQLSDKLKSEINETKHSGHGDVDYSEFEVAKLNDKLVNNIANRVEQVKNNQNRDGLYGDKAISKAGKAQNTLAQNKKLNEQVDKNLETAAYLGAEEKILAKRALQQKTAKNKVNEYNDLSANKTLDRLQKMQEQKDLLEKQVDENLKLAKQLENKKTTVKRTTKSTANDYLSLLIEKGVVSATDVKNGNVKVKRPRISGLNVEETSSKKPNKEHIDLVSRDL